MSVHQIDQQPIHLGLGASADPQPTFTGDMDWYADYASRHATDGAEGRLVSMHTFSAPWDVWEVHPEGSEVVLCVSGEITLIQELSNGDQRRIDLKQGEYAINEPGVWHTADTASSTTVLFITAGKGTEHRPR